DYRPIQPNERGVIQQAIAAPAAVASHLMESSASPRSAALSAGTRMTATTVWPPDTPRPTPEHPRLALVLVPRYSAGSTPAGQTSAGQTWVFPLNRPAPPGSGDNQSM